MLLRSLHLNQFEWVLCFLPFAVLQMTTSHHLFVQSDSREAEINPTASKKSWSQWFLIPRFRLCWLCSSLLPEKTCLVALSLKSIAPWCSETWGRGSALMTRTTRWDLRHWRTSRNVHSLSQELNPPCCVWFGRTLWPGAPRSTATPRAASATASCPATTTASSSKQCPVRTSLRCTTS